MTSRFIPVSALVFFCSIGSIYNGWAIAADEVKPADSAIPADLDKAVKVGSFGQIDLHVKDQDLSKILQLLSIQSQRNIIVNKGVSGTVSADLYGVDFYQALDAILQPNGFGYLEKGNFIYVYTIEDLQRIKDADRKVVTRVYRLNYLNAEDANVLLTSVLSSAGKVQLTTKPIATYQPSVTDAGSNSYALSDTLIVTDYPEHQDEVARIIKEMDTRPKQILVESTVLSAKLMERNALGVNISILANLDFNTPLSFNNIGSMFGAGSGAGGTTISGWNGQGVEWNNILSDESSFRVGLIYDDVSAIVEALDKVTDTTVLANPKILVMNRQRGKLHVGQKLGYLNTTTSEGGSINQSVEFLEVGTELVVRPFTGDDDMIRMEIQPKVSTGEVRISNGLTIPTENTQELITNIMVRNGQTVILGGLFKESTTVSRKQVPMVGDIPLLGEAFRGKSDSIDRDEFIFLLTPSIVKDKVLYAHGERMKDDAEMLRVGARQGLLPFSRSKLVASHVKNALDSMDRGDNSKALHSVDMALSMDPTYVDARRLKEKLTNERVFTPYDSVLQDSAAQMIEASTPAPAPAAEPAPVPAPKVEAPKAEPAPAPKAEAPKAESAPAPAPTVEAPVDEPAPTAATETPATPTAAATMNP